MMKAYAEPATGRNSDTSAVNSALRAGVIDRGRADGRSRAEVRAGARGRISQTVSRQRGVSPLRDFYMGRFR